jgi:DNA-binding transcriptional regulator YhcF (GntR family)
MDGPTLTSQYNSLRSRYSGDSGATSLSIGDLSLAGRLMGRTVEKGAPAFTGGIASIDRPDLVTHVTAGLRKHILAGKLQPGSELPPEAKLAESFGVSRTVIREAMRHLRSQGLVEVMRGRKPRVKAVSTEASVDAINLLLQRAEASLPHLLEARFVVPWNPKLPHSPQPARRPNSSRASSRPMKNFSPRRPSPSGSIATGHSTSASPRRATILSSLY